jgi:hypothetical protein
MLSILSILMNQVTKNLPEAHAKILSKDNVSNLLASPCQKVAQCYLPKVPIPIKCQCQCGEFPYQYIYPSDFSSRWPLLLPPLLLDYLLTCFSNSHISSRNCLTFAHLNFLKYFILFDNFLVVFNYPSCNHQKKRIINKGWKLKLYNFFYLDSMEVLSLIISIK